MPNLYRLSQCNRYIKQIIPSPGFCERSEIFSCLDAYDTGNFTAIGYLPENSPYKNNPIILDLFGMLGNNRITRKLFSIWRRRTGKCLNNYRIPFKSLKYFALTEDGEDAIIEHDDIFTQLKKANMTYTLDAFTSLSDITPRHISSPINYIKDNINKQIDFIPYYIGKIDAVGHRFGKDMEDIKPYLLEVDNIINLIFHIVHENNYALAILGDHGMVPVEKKLDIMSKVQALDIKIHKDYEAFYDSTSVRFWFINSRARLLIQSLFELEFSNYGTIINDNNCRKYRIPLDVYSSSGKPIYGDFLWCANPGVLVSPDYFHAPSSSESGMHGYIKIVEEVGTGLYVAVGSNISSTYSEREHSYKVCRELCNILEIAVPNMQWKRILK